MGPGSGVETTYFSAWQKTNLPTIQLYTEIPNTNLTRSLHVQATGGYIFPEHFKATVSPIIYYCMLSSVVVNKLLVNEERVICAKVGLNAACGYKLAFTSSQALLTHRHQLLTTHYSQLHNMTALAIFLFCKNGKKSRYFQSSDYHIRGSAKPHLS